jgi:hypothetical protein
VLLLYYGAILADQTEKWSRIRLLKRAGQIALGQGPIPRQIGFGIDLQSAPVGCDGILEQLAAFFSAAARSKITKRLAQTSSDAQTSAGVSSSLADDEYNFFAYPSLSCFLAVTERWRVDAVSRKSHRPGRCR